MDLKKEEIASIKRNLLEQLKNFPEDKRQTIEEQINRMDDEQIEEFVKQNQLTHLPGGCVFCSIVEGKNPSIKIEETEDAAVILEINPISKGHSLVVPKKHVEKVSIQIKDLAGKISKKMKKILGVKEVTIREIKIMDHAIIEVIPLYGNETERYSAKRNELLEMQKTLTQTITQNEMIEDDSRAEEIVKKIVAKKEAIPHFSPRIPRFS